MVAAQMRVMAMATTKYRILGKLMRALNFYAKRWYHAIQRLSNNLWSEYGFVERTR